MTSEQFDKYCKRNKPTKIIAQKYSIVFHFKKRVVIEVTNGIDGLIYTKWMKQKGNSMALIADLLEVTPGYLDEMKRKYGTEAFNNKLKQLQ